MNQPLESNEVLENAAAKLQSEDRKNWRKWILLMVGAVALVSLALVVGTTAYRFIQFKGLIRMSLSSDIDGESPAINPFVKKLPPEKRLLMFGITDAEHVTEKWQPLWESDRSNPAYLQAYAEGYYTDRKEIPLDVLKQAEAIDPGNAYLPTLAAAALSQLSVERESRSWLARKSPDAPKWIIKDQARFDQAYEALRKAADFPSFTDHTITLNQQRVRHLLPGRDFLERASILAYLAALPSTRIGSHHLANLLATKASTFDDPADIAEFRECLRLWRWLAGCSAETSWTLIDGLITKAIIQAPLKNFRDAAARLGLEDVSRDFRLLDEQLTVEKEQRKAKGKEDFTLNHMIETKGSIMACLQVPMVIGQVNSPPVLREDDFKPGRLTDHALLGQAHATIAAVCFGLLALAALLYGAVVPRTSQIDGYRLADLVSPRDRILLFVIGILGPLGFYYALIQIPHLSAREWNMRISGFIAPVGQLAGLTLLMINLTIALGARLIRKRLPMLELAHRSWRRSLPWVGVFSSILMLLLFGTFHSTLFRVGIALAIPASCWPLVFLLPQILRKFRVPNLRQAVLHEVLAPLWAGAVIIFSLLFALHRSDEFKWTERDQLLVPDPEVRGMSYIEGVVAKQLASEVQELVKALPQP